MGYKYTGDSVLGLSLTVNTPKPLDARTVVENTTELYSIPKDTAYKGMTVAVISNGNIYMLVGDQLNPTNPVDPSVPQQWRASYEAIQIITCTQAEYIEWEKNTNNYVAIDPEKPYLREDVYYYIYEDSMNRSDKEPGEVYPETEVELEKQAYVSYAQLQALDKRVQDKASSSEVEALRTSFNTLATNITNNYTTTENLVKNYASLEYVQSLIDTENEESFVSSILNKYYTSDEIDSTFVTQAWLKGDAEGEDFVFVTKAKYDSDQQAIQTELNSTLKTEEDGSVKNLTVETLTSSQENLNIQTNELQINSNKVALSSEVPTIEVLSKEEYDAKSNSNELEDDTYYYVYSDEQKDGVVTNEMLEQYWTVAKIKEYMYNTENPLVQKISELEDTIKELTDRISNLETV